MKKITFLEGKDLKDVCGSNEHWGELKYYDEYDNRIHPEMMSDTISIVITDEQFQEIIDNDDEGDLSMHYLEKYLDKDQLRIVNDTNDCVDYYPLAFVKVEDYVPSKINKKVIGGVLLAGALGAAYYKFK